MIVLMQNQVYSRYVYQMLMSYGRVAIPSLGTFTLHPLTATFNNDRSKLSPPATQISFNSLVVEDVLFERQLIDAGMSAVDAKQMQASLVSDYNTAWRQNQRFELGSFGTLTPEGFVEKSEGTFNRYLGLEPISIAALPTYLKRNGDFTKVADAPIILTSQASTSTNNYLWPILLALLTLAVILAWFFSSDTNEIKEPVVQEETETEIAHTSALNDDSLLTEIDSILESKEATKVTKDSANQIVMKPVTPEIKEAEVKNSQSIATMKSCIVIVGAFKNTHNADKLIKRIRAKGFKTYSQMHNGLKRVGISYDCIAKNPDLFKTSVQKQFNKDAWHLHDTI